MDNIVLIGPPFNRKQEVGVYLSRKLRIPFLNANFYLNPDYDPEIQHSVLKHICYSSHVGEIIVSAGNSWDTEEFEAFWRCITPCLSGFGEVFYLLPSPSLERSTRILTDCWESASKSPSNSFRKELLEDRMRAMLLRTHPSHALTAKFPIYTEGKAVAQVADEIVFAMDRRYCPNPLVLSHSSFQRPHL